MRRWVVLAAVAAAVGAPPAGAVPLGGTVLLDRPTGFGALPFDGVSNSETGFHGLTPDGRFAVIDSQSNSLLSGDEDTARNVYRIDLTTGAIVQVDTTAAGGQPTPASDNRQPSISADGNHVGFMTTSPALAAGASDNNPQFVVKNIATGGIELASRSNGAAGATVANLGSALLSGDGRHVMFTAQSAVQAANATGTTSTEDAYVRDLNANTTRMVSVTDPGGAEGGGVRDLPDIDFAGDAVAFVTSSALVATDTDSNDDGYVRTGIGGTEHTVLVSFSGGGQTSGADNATAVALANTATSIQLAWIDNGNVWWAPCTTTTTCNTPATMADQPQTGGTDNRDNDNPFFPPQQSATTGLPTRVYWITDDPLDPADTNGDRDVYGWDIGGVNPNTSIHLMTGGDAIGGVFGSSATNDGAVTAFSSSGPNLPGSNGIVGQAFVRRAGTDTNISQPLGQPPRTDAAGFGFVFSTHAISDDGRFVLFTSDAPALGAPNTPGGPADEVLVRDVVAGTTQLASAVSGTQTAGNEDSFDGGIDAAGDRAVFETAATNLVAGDGNHQVDVFVRDLRTGTTTLVDRTAGGGVPSDGAEGGQISADGTKVVFLSDSPDIPGAPPDSKRHIYEVDLATGDVTLIDRTTAGAVANDNANGADVDGDGRRVAFISTASNLGGGTDGSLYLRDLSNPAAPTTTWLSMPQGGLPTSDFAGSPTIDRDGGRVAFTERSTSFGFGMTGTEQVFVHAVATGATTLVSTGPSGAASTFANGPSISADGSRVTFSSNAPNLPAAMPSVDEVYLRDLTVGTTVLASTRDGAGTPGRFGSGGGAVSGNGACVAFGSTSDDLVAGGYSSDFEHVFLHALGAACPAAGGPPPPPPPDRTPPVISRFSVSHKRFAVGPKPTALSAAKRKKKQVVRGTTFTFSLSEAATTRIAITQKLTGHRASPKKPCKAPRRGQRRNCTRTITLLTLVRRHTRQGANRIAFSGRYGRKRLARGTYTATVTATDPSGNRSRPRQLTFTVIA